MKIIHITDFHLPEPDTLLWGNDPYKRLDCCLQDICKFHSDAEFCFISGDLTEKGSLDAYGALRERLDRFPLKTVLMIGNHDHRENFLTAFPDTPRDHNGFAQQILDTGKGRFIFTDTISEPGNSAGWYCVDRQNWLRGQIETAPGAVYIAVHHPPFDIGISYMDRIKLREHLEFERLVAGNSNINHIFFGHVHRVVFGNWRGIPYSALPGLNHQVPLNRESVGNSYSDEPPMYGVITLADGQTTIHYDAYWDRKPLPDPPQRK